MKKIIYIAGLGHSGSTILNPALGCHPNIVGLGEIYAVFNKKQLLNEHNNRVLNIKYLSHNKESLKFSKIKKRGVK